MTSLFDESPAESAIVVCPFCQGRSVFDFAYYSRTYYRCPSCFLIHQDKTKAKKNEIDDYYKKKYFQDYADDQPSRDSMRLNSHILDFIENHKMGGRLLDVGCGCGYFLQEAKKRGWTVMGVDLSEDSVAQARSLVGDCVLTGSLEDIGSDLSFDVIAMVNVLDHMADPFENIRKSRAFLRQGGMLYLRFPNGFFHRWAVKLQAKITGVPLLNRMLVFHEYVFTPRFIAMLLEKEGFERIAVRNAKLSGAALFGESPTGKYLGLLINTTVSAIVFFVKALTGGKTLLGPSLEIMAVKGHGQAS